MREGRRKFWGLVALCSVGAYFFVVGVPASAHTEPQVDGHWNPRIETAGVNPGDCGTIAPGAHTVPAVGQGTDIAEDECVSDVDYGFGQDFVLKAETGLAAVYVQWYDCVSGANPNVPGAACQLIAFDTSGLQSAPPPGASPFLSWTASWNITNNSETNNPRDLFIIGCSNDAAGVATQGPPYDTSHCTPDGPHTIHVDAAGFVGPHPAGTPDTSGGRIEVIQEADGTVFTSREQVHNAGLQNGQNIDVIAFTGPAGQHDAIDLCIGRIGAGSPIFFNTPAPAGVAQPDGTGGGCTYNFTDLVPTPGGGAACDDSAPTVAGADCWAFKGIDVLDLNNQFVFLIVEIDDLDNADPPSGASAITGTGDCAGNSQTGLAGAGNDCILDPIYVTTTVSGKPPTGPPAPPGPPPPVVTKKCKKKVGNARDNVLKGTRGCDKLLGKAGDDKLKGRGGNDVLKGGPGFDVCKGGPGKDRARGCEVKRSL